MKEGVKREIQMSFENYSRKERSMCLLESCAMAILTVEMINWTALVEESLRDK